MSFSEFNDDCLGCRPALLDLTTGRAMAQDSSIMMAVNRVWDEQTTREQRECYHRVCCLNSRDEEDVRQTQAICLMMKEEVEKKMEGE